MPWTSNEGDLSRHSSRAISLGAIATGEKDPFSAEGGNKLAAFAENMALGALGPLGSIVVGLAVDQIKKAVSDKQNQNHLGAGIKILAEKKIPGFEYQETVIDGQPVKIAVDASSSIKNPDAKPYVLLDAENKDHPDVIALKEAAAHKAKNDAIGFTQNIAAQNAAYAENKKKYDEAFPLFLDALQRGEQGDKPTQPVPVISPENQMAITLNKQVDNAKANQEATPSATPKLQLSPA